MKKISKASMKRLVKSDFFHELLEVVKAWDYYLGVKDYETAKEMMYKWEMSKLALLHITGNVYGFSRDGEGNYSVVNERDYNDRIICGFTYYEGGENEIYH